MKRETRERAENQKMERLREKALSLQHYLSFTYLLFIPLDSYFSEGGIMGSQRQQTETSHLLLEVFDKAFIITS